MKQPKAVDCWQKSDWLTTRESVLACPHSLLLRLLGVSAAIYLAFGCDGSFGACAQDNWTATRSDVIKWLEDYERAYWGMRVVASSPGGAYEPQVQRFSKDGNTAISELYAKQYIPGHGVRENIVCDYLCSDYCLSLTQTVLEGFKQGIYEGALRSEDHFPVAFSNPWLLGLLQTTGLRFSQVVADPRSIIAIKPGHRFNQDGLEVDVKIPGKGELGLFFIDRDSPKLLGGRQQLKRGDKVVHIKGVSKLGFPRPKEWNETVAEDGDGVAIEFSEAEAGPIEYDKNGKPKRVVVQYTIRQTDGKVIASQVVQSIESYRPLREDLPKNQVVPSKMELPERLPIQMWGTNVPHELRDGRLVSLLDGEAMEVGQKVGFRSPTFFERHRWLLSFAVLVGLGGIGFYVYHRRFRK